SVGNLSSNKREVELTPIYTLNTIVNEVGDPIKFSVLAVETPQEYILNLSDKDICGSLNCLNFISDKEISLPTELKLSSGLLTQVSWRLQEENKSFSLVSVGDNVKSVKLRVVQSDEKDVDGILIGTFTFGREYKQKQIEKEKIEKSFPVHVTGKKSSTTTSTDDQSAIDAAKEKIKEASMMKTILNGNVAVDQITNDLKLPNSLSSGVTIRWESSDNTIIDTNGAVHHKITSPATSEPKKYEVELTPVFSRNSVLNVKGDSIKFTVVGTGEAVVPPVSSTVLQDYLVEVRAQDICGSLNCLDFTSDNETTLSTELKGPNGSLIEVTWKLQQEGNSFSLVPEAGPVKLLKLRASPSEGKDVEGTLIGTFTLVDSRSGEKTESREKIFPLHLIGKMVTTVTEGTEDLAKINNDRNELTTKKIGCTGTEFNEVTKGLNLPSIGSNGSRIVWTSEKDEGGDDFISSEGVVKKEYSSDRKVILTARLFLGSYLKEKKLEVIIKASK
ncbi:MAG: hypothetical protein HQK53_14600, partial [Oligoflexia bacterium]|nr:hypothetical protein [Oligoflexia bacterium]